MTSNPDTKICKCGAEFTRSRNDYTVNCPDCRKGKGKNPPTSFAPTSDAERDKYFEMGRKDGRKNGHKPGFSGYRAAVWGWGYAKTVAYENGFKAGKAEVA